MAGRFFVILLLFLNSCHVSDYLYYNLADLGDTKIFPSITVQHGPQTFRFPAGQLPESDTLKSFLASGKTVAFLIIRNDSLLFEEYFHGYGASSLLPSFSVAKPVVSVLTGIATEEGAIRSVDQKVTDFLPWMTDTMFRHVSIRNLLEMRAGLNYNDRGIGPFGKVARFYYGDNLKEEVKKLKVTGIPGQGYQYQSASTQILAMVIESATGKKLPVYLEEKIWKPAGMAYDATWSIDSEEHQVTKGFCCLNARASDFARFGLLVEKRGMIHGDTLVSPSWISESTSITDSAGYSNDFYYAYNFRVLPDGDFFMKGVHGQYIYISPGKRLVFIRFGKQNGKTDWIGLFRELKSRL